MGKFQKFVVLQYLFAIYLVGTQEAELQSYLFTVRPGNDDS